MPGQVPLVAVRDPTASAARKHGWSRTGPCLGHNRTLPRAQPWPPLKHYTAGTEVEDIGWFLQYCCPLHLNAVIFKGSFLYLELHVRCTIRYPLSNIHYPLSTIHYPLSTIHYPLSTFHYPLKSAAQKCTCSYQTFHSPPHSSEA